MLGTVIAFNLARGKKVSKFLLRLYVTRLGAVSVLLIGFHAASVGSYV